MTIPSGWNFSTVSQSGIAFDVCWTINTTEEPEYPELPFYLGTQVTGLDNSIWCFCKPANDYAIGTCGYIDNTFNFIALTNSNGANAIGSAVGVMSQVASVTINPTQYNYDGIWVQIAGACPAMNVAASTTVFTQLYTSSVVGRLTSVSGGTPIDSIVTVTTSGIAGNQQGIISS